MKNIIEWFEERGAEFEGPVTVGVADIVALQNDARKDGLMTAQMIASEVINRESPKYAKPDQTPPEQALSGLNYFVCSAIVSEADKLDYLPGKKQ